MTMPIYASPEQFMRDRSEYARKGIARGRSVVVVTLRRRRAVRRGEPLADAAQGQRDLRPDRLRRGRPVQRVREPAHRRHPAGRRARLLLRPAGRHRPLAGQRLRADPRASFSEQQKPFEVELCVAEVGAEPAGDQLYRITYDGSITDERRFVVMGGQTDPISSSMRGAYQEGSGWPTPWPWP